MIRGHTRHVWAWLVLLLAIGAVLGHVLPTHAHADEVGSPRPGAGAQGQSDDHAVYRASRGALETVPAPLNVGVVASPALALPFVARKAARVAAVVRRVESRPLFLLHAALLI